MRALVAGILLFLAVLAIATGVLYLVEPAHSLPTFLPGYVAGANGKHPRHGYAGIAVGVVLAVLGIIMLVTAPNKPTSAHS